MQSDLQLLADIKLSSQAINTLNTVERAKNVGSGFKDNISSGLGTISRSFTQFDKSLDASNARVLAFGASAGLILGLQRAFSLLIRETVGVEKAFASINVILGLSNRALTAYGAQLFDIAKNTGQSFSVVTEAAQELARQGLSASETLKRTRDALILTRQSGLDAAESVKTITTALNSFNKEALDSTQIINKLANVDANFAVSSKDLAEALSRTGSAAQDAGLNINQLIGLVTAAQQITGRGGAVIAQALNSVFARVSRPEVLEQLRELGVQINSSQTGTEKLINLSKAIDSASVSQSAMIKEAAGGVRNLNILSAVLRDLSSQYSITKRATDDATHATDQAIQRNEQLNNTYSTLTNKTLINLQQVSAQFGKLTLGPGLERVLGGLNILLEGAISKNADSAGEILGQGLLKGLGEFLGGPGLVLIGGAIISLVKRLAGEAGTAFKTVIGLNEVAKQRAAIELNITNVLEQQPKLIQQALSGYEGQLAAIRAINTELLKGTQLKEAASLLTSTVVTRGIVKRNAGGIIPHFAPLTAAVSQELTATGLPLSQIRVGTDPRLSGSGNNLGLGVYNVRDEPLGLAQGISRALGEGANPRTYGNVPHFALEPSTLGLFGSSGTYQSLAQKVQAGALSADKAIAELDKLNKTFNATSDQISRMTASFRGLETVSKNLIRSPLLTQSQIVAQGGGIRFGPNPEPIFLGNINRPAFSGQRYPSQYGYAGSLANRQALEFPGLYPQGRTPLLLGYNNPYEERARILQGQAILGPIPPTNPNRRLLEYKPLIAAGSHAGIQSEFPGYSSQGLINQQAQLNLLANQAALHPAQQEAEAIAVAQQEAAAKKAYTQQLYNTYQRKSLIAEALAKSSSGGIPGIFSRATTNFGNALANPANQNKFLLASFLGPIAGGIASTAIGNQNTTQRGFGATAQGLGNVIGYGALGASFGGPVGAAIGAGGGLAIEIPRIVKSFTDIVPDLNRQLEKLKEQVGQLNDGFSSIIQDNQKLVAYQRGELNLNPTQYGNLKTGLSNRINQLAVTFPKYATQIRAAGNSTNIEDQEKVLALISEATSRETLPKAIRAGGESIVPSSALGRAFQFHYATKEDTQDYASNILNSPSQSSKNKLSISDYLIEQIKSNPTNNIANDLEKSFKKLSQAAIYQVDEITGNVTGTINGKTENLSGGIAGQQGIALRQRLLQEGNTGLLSGLGKLQQTGQYPGLNDLINRLKLLEPGSKGYNDLTESLQEKFNIPSLKESVNIPGQDPAKVSKDYAELLRSFTNLRNNIDLFTGRLQIITESDLAGIQRNLTVNLSNIKTGAAIGTLRSQYSPFTALGIERRAGIEEINSRQISGVAALTSQFNRQQQAAPASLIASIQDAVLKRVESGKGGAPTLFPTYNKYFNETLFRTLPLSATLPAFGTGASSEDVVNSFLKNAKPQEIEQFSKNIKTDKQRLLKQLLTETDPENKSVIIDVIKAENDFLKNRALDIDKYKSETEKLAAEAAAQSTELNNDIQVKTTQIIENSISPFAGLVNNLDALRESALKSLGQISTGVGKGPLGPLSAGRLATFNASQAALNGPGGGRDLLGQGLLSREQFKQNYLVPGANATLEQTGQVPGKTLGELFGSGFQYNQRDFFKEVKDDAISAGDEIKASFSSAFKSFVDGSKSASDAARQLGISIASNILSKAADIGFNSLLGGVSSAIGSIFGGSTKKAGGGLVGYASGGMVVGGSGIRDDILTSVPKGSFVMQKSAVNQYGYGLLNSLNDGGPVKFAGGGGVNVTLRNQFNVSGRGKRTTGAFNVDPRLSVIGQTDENNPFNRLKFQNEQDYIGYLRTIQQYKLAVNQFEASKNQRVIGAGISAAFGVAGAGLGAAFSSPTTSTAAGSVGSTAGTFDSQGNFISPTFATTNNSSTQFGPYVSPSTFTAFGGHSRGGVIGYAGGGQVDNVPALLTGGEYVVRPSAVKQYGVSTMNAINSGRFPLHLADGGLVGRDISSINPIIQDGSGEGWKQIITAINKQTKTLDDIKTLFDNKNNQKNASSSNASNASQGNAITNQVSINITVADNGKTNTTSQSGGNGKQKDQDSLKKFAELMKDVSLKTIIEQSRPGGLLQSVGK